MKGMKKVISCILTGVMLLCPFSAYAEESMTAEETFVEVITEDVSEETHGETVVIEESLSSGTIVESADDTDLETKLESSESLSESETAPEKTDRETIPESETEILVP